MCKRVPTPSSRRRQASWQAGLCGLALLCLPRPFPLPRHAVQGALLCVMLTCLAWPAAAEVDRAQVEAVMAGFVYNFVKFAEWPGIPSDSQQPLRVCASGAHPLGGQLARLQDRNILQRRVVVLTQVAPAEWPGCHVLFVGSGEGGKLDTVLRGLGRKPVLTVGTLPGFIQAGGMIGMRQADNRIRFEVNLAAAQRVDLKLSSQMLKLASEVLQ